MYSNNEALISERSGMQGLVTAEVTVRFRLAEVAVGRVGRSRLYTHQAGGSSNVHVAVLLYDTWV